MKPKVSIIYGFAEGRALGRDLRRQLRGANFINTRLKSRADVIIAHSGGCLLIPKRNQAKLILLVDPPYWPGKRITLSLQEKLKRDIAHHRDVKKIKRLTAKTGHHSRYFVTKAHRTIRMYHAHKITRFPKPFEGQQIYLLRNEHDPLCSPEIKDILPHAKAYHYQGLPGEHDDLWHYPEKYVDLIRSVLK